jgi:hypothetical protein
MITAKQGRATEELGTILGTLLVNIVMAWNTHHLRIVLDRAPGDHPDKVVSRLAPIGHKHSSIWPAADKAYLANRSRVPNTGCRAEKSDSLMISMDCHAHHKTIL